MKKLDEVRALFEPGDVFVCVENTYRPVLNGTRRRIVSVGATFYDSQQIDGPDAGQLNHNFFPKRAGDVVAIGDGRVTYRLTRGDHTVTLAKEAS